MNLVPLGFGANPAPSDSYYQIQLEQAHDQKGLLDWARRRYESGAVQGLHRRQCRGLQEIRRPLHRARRPV